MNKKPLIFGIVVWDDPSSSESEQDIPPCYRITIGLLTYKNKCFHILSEDILSPGFEPGIYKTRIKKGNIEFIIPLKIDLPEIPQNLSEELTKLLQDRGFLDT